MADPASSAGNLTAITGVGTMRKRAKISLNLDTRYMEVWMSNRDRISELSDDPSPGLMLSGPRYIVESMYTVVAVNFIRSKVGV